jgi:hypothetical protein
MNNNSEVFGFTWPHLSQANNGFGGSVTFAYALKDNTDNGLHWERSAVTSETRTGHVPSSGVRA